ncbi:MAG: SRPBCC family protein [Bacteroidota bacterium]
MKYTVQSSIEIAAPAAQIFTIISDHEGTPNWVSDVKKVVLAKPGNGNKNGKGAMRRVTFRPVLWSTVDEEILTFEEGKGYTYRIMKGMPGLLDHLGQWELEESAGVTKVTWTVGFDFKVWHWFRPFHGNFVGTFKGVQEKALAGLKSAIKAQSPTSLKNRPTLRFNPAAFTISAPNVLLNSSTSEKIPSSSSILMA